MSDPQADQPMPVDAPATSSEAPAISTQSAPATDPSTSTQIQDVGESSKSTADIRQQVEREQALADAQRRLKELEGEVENVRKEKSGVEGERDSALQATNQLRTQLSALQSSFHKTTSELSVLQTRVEITEKEKTELLEETVRLQDRSSRSNQELYTLRAQKSETAQKIAHLDVEVSEQRMAAESAKFNEERSKQALDAARTENLRVGKTYTDLEERFGKYRAEKQSQLSTLQTEHDIILSRLTTAESSYQALQRSYNEQANRLASAFADISNLTSAAATRKATSQSEAYRLADENRLLERRAEEARSTIVEREAELERIVLAHDEQSREWEAKWKSEEKRRREADKRAEELRKVVDKIALAGGEGGDLSPAAALAGELKSTGKSYTQFFMEYTVQEGKLRAAENEIGRLTDLLDEIANDIAEKKPLLDEQAAEHAAAIDRANALAGELAMVMTTRDTFEETVKGLKAAASHHTEEVSFLQSTADDLSRQVQNLLRQLAIRDDPSLANIEINGSSATSSSPSGDVITDHLLEFRSLRGLQENNQKLLKLTRALMAKLDAREIRRATADQDEVDTGATLDQATETIEKLHKQLLDANRKINEATRERDFFSKLLARGEGLKWGGGGGENGSGSGSGGGGPGPLDDTPTPHLQTIEMLRSEIEGVRVKAEEEARELKVELRSREEAVGVAEVAKARAEVKVTMLEEQARSLTEANNLQKQRGEGLESQIRQIQASIGTAQNEARMAMEQVALRQAEADRLRMEVAVLRAEKEQWSSTEARLQSDFRSVQTERAKLQQLIENHSHISAESDRSRKEERSRLEQRVDELTRETTALRTQIDQARQATRSAEAKVSAADSALESAVSSIRSEKISAETLAATRQTEIEALQVELSKTKEASDNLRRIGLNWKKRHDEIKVELTTAQSAQSRNNAVVEGKDKEIGEVRQELEGAKKELEEGRKKLEEVEKRLESTLRSEGLKESTVQRLQSELNAARQRNAGTVTAAAGQDAAVAAGLTAEKEALQARVTQLEKDLDAAKAAAPTTVPAEGSTEPNTSTGEGSSGGDAAQLQAKNDTLTKELEDLNKRYEDNVTKVNRTNAAMRARITELSNEKAEALAKIAELEQQISAASTSTSTSKTAASGEGDSADISQAKIDEAVKAAVAAKEAEHAQALEAARSASVSGGENGGSGSGTAADPEAIASAIKAKEAELNSTLESRVNEAIAKHKSELEAEKTKLNTQVEELSAKIKNLEKQARTAEISRKTLERQKNDAEGKAKRLEAAASEGKVGPAQVGLAPVPTLTLSSTPAAASTSTSASATTGNAQLPSVPSAPAARGTAVRGRGRGGPVRGGAPAGRPSVLQNVNATLTAAQPVAPSPPSTPSAQKRPAPEEGEITEPTSTSAAAAGDASFSLPSSSSAPAVGDGGDVLARLKGGDGPRGRVLKRPRGAGPARGGGRGGAPVSGAAVVATPTPAQTSEGAASGQERTDGNKGAGKSEGGGQGS